ncbi:hypothetical protein JD79_02056 [Geodermatophilus normandii]|uniref:Uncharacterized protein n=1 Tax=Geodermatophilus normandii TaxID=1137989 RepID=A0A317QIV4_9ACTN|nr:hypothetical protein [Geodermatophilus normandii]PWW22893.1 hypothetical protein JD79_02056 [Geodermatophilus normandii]
MNVRTRSALCALTAGLVVLAPSAAVADPPAGDDRTPSCSQLHRRVLEWPGLGHGGQRVFSDAYELSLLSQPACTDPDR